MIEEIGQVWLMMVIEGICDNSSLPISSDEASTITDNKDREHVDMILSSS